MPHNELVTLIAKLKQEIAQFDEDQQGSREQIELLIRELETHIATGGTEDWPADMTARVREEVEKYETEHLQITNILNNIMVTLSSMGI